MKRLALSSKSIPKFTAAALTLAAFALRLAYALRSNPFVDEFTTVLAAQSILQRGWPVLPSGLFYEHGLLFSYLDAPFVAMASTANLITLARLPSVLIGAAMVPLLYRLGRRWFSPWVGLGAAALLAFSPEGMVWGGRARMYALAQLLVLLTVFWAFEGSRGRGNARLRWLALSALAAGLLTQFGTLMFVPPLVAAVAALRILAATKGGYRRRLTAEIRWPALKPWLLQTGALAAVIVIGMLVKRLGQPLGMAQLGETTAQNPALELWRTLSYQIGLALDVDSAVSFLARQFGVPHHLWLTGAAMAGLLLLMAQILHRPAAARRHAPLIFLWLVFGLTIVEMLTLLEPFRRNPRYVGMGLPLFYLPAAQSVALLFRQIANFRPLKALRAGSYLAGALLAGFIALQTGGQLTDLLIAWRTPEPAYDRAFQFVAARWQPDDAVLTVHPPAAALYLPRLDYFAQQDNAAQFLLNVDTENPVDRWLGVPWLHTAAQLNDVLNSHARVWFVADEQRLTTFGFFRGDWLATLDAQMERVWAVDGALVFRSRANRVAIPTAPAVPLNATFGDLIKLTGYTFDAGSEPPRLTLFWQALAPIPVDYTVFVQLRNAENAIVQGWDRQPLDGAYPTHLWQPGESPADTIPLALSAPLPDDYRLAIGLYRLDTPARLPLKNDTSGENAIYLTEDLWP